MQMLENITCCIADVLWFFQQVSYNRRKYCLLYKPSLTYRKSHIPQPLRTMQAISLSTLPLPIPFPQFPFFALKKYCPFLTLSPYDCFVSSPHLKVTVSHFPICLRSLQQECQECGWPLLSWASLHFFLLNVEFICLLFGEICSHYIGWVTS